MHSTLKLTATFSLLQTPWYYVHQPEWKIMVKTGQELRKPQSCLYLLKKNDEYFIAANINPNNHQINVQRLSHFVLN